MLPGARVSKGRRYWVAVLGVGGRLQLRSQRGGRAESSRGRRLSALPARWRKGKSSRAGRMSAWIS